ncbi:SDR family oxidoreductase [Halobacteriaceae archaeon GCM10025711]
MRVAILGCGYVGLELGRQLSAAGHSVVGVRRSDAGLAAIEDAGFEAVRADVTDPSSLAAVPDVDALVYAASAGGRDVAAARAVYVDGLRAAIDAFGARENPPDQVVYTSSTGVYGDRGGDWVDEETPVDPDSERAEMLVEAERVARERGDANGLAVTVVRFAGLYGPGRYRLDRYLDGPMAPGYLNLVHRDDAAGVVRFALESVAEDLLVAVDHEPVSKWLFADWLADQCGVPRPDKRTLAEAVADASPASARRLRASKRCSNRRLRSLGYEFAFPTFREGYRPAVAAYRRDEVDGA